MVITGGKRMLTKKSSMIINHLCNKDGYTTANELSSILDVSTKTVKRAMSDINQSIKEYNVSIVSSRGLGYIIEGSKKDIDALYAISQTFLDGMKEDSIEKRIEMFICMLINNESISIEEISEALCLSIASTNKIFAKVKKILSTYKISIKSKPCYGSYIEGNEEDIRKLMLDYAINMNINENIHSEIDNIYSKEINMIEKIILDKLKENRIIISDKDFNILLSKTIISLSRVRREKRFLISEDKSIELTYLNIIKDIIEDIFKKLEADFDEDELYYICSHIKKLENSLIETKVNNIINNSLDDIYLISGIDYKKDTEFMNMISVHMLRLINRVFDKLRLNNPLTFQVKSSFPMELNLANLLTKNMEKEFNIEVNEEEISYIAIHFAVATQRIKKYKSKNVCIICHYGIGTGQLIAEKLKQTMSDINIVGVYPTRYIDLALNDNVDLIISTVQLKEVKKEVIYVSNVFSDEVIENIKRRITEGEERRKILMNMFNKNAFYYDIKVETKEEVLEYLGKKMIEDNFITTNSINRIIEREKNGSTETGNLVAIPHAIVDEDIESIIGVGILEKPILWEKQEVQLVFMVFLNKKQKQNAPIFRHLYNFIKDIGGVKSIINSKDFDKLVDTIS